MADEGARAEPIRLPPGWRRGAARAAMAFVFYLAIAAVVVAWWETTVVAVKILYQLGAYGLCACLHGFCAEPSFASVVYDSPVSAWFT